MSTYANITIKDRNFHLSSDGDDRELLEEIVKGYVRKYKGLVKPEILSEVIINSILADNFDLYPLLEQDLVELAPYHWHVVIGPRGGVRITGGKVKKKVLDGNLR